MDAFSKYTDKPCQTLLSKEQIAKVQERVKKFRPGRSKEYMLGDVKKMARESEYQVDNKKS
jgi:hypothetical protein